MTTVEILSLTLAAALLASAALKLSGKPAVTGMYTRVGVPESRLPLLAAILVAGAVGLIAGLWWPALGAAANIGVAVYFTLAVLAHIRAGDERNLGAPLVLLALAVAALAFRYV